MVARFRLKVACKKFTPREISLPSDLSNVQCIMVCLPGGQRELTMVKNFLPELTRIFARAKIYLLASPGSSIYDIFPRKGYYIMTPTSKHLNWCGLPSRDYIKSLKENKYDLILDTNLRINYFAQMLLLSFPGAIRVGRANHLGQPYYNLEIKTRYIRDERNIYKSMIETLDRLINFGRPETNEMAS
jgi:hypothetical protein